MPSPSPLSTADQTPPPWWQRHQQKLVAGGIWALLLGGLSIYMALHNLTLADMLRHLLGVLREPYGPLLFVLLYAVRPLTFFSATVFSLSSGALYGPVLGMVYTVLGSSAAASVAFGLGRFFGRGLMTDQESASVVSRYAERLRYHSFETSLLLHAMLLPFDPLNYLCGVLRARYVPFLLGTVLGSLPGILTFVLTGSMVRVDDALAGNVQLEIDPLLVMLAGGLIIASFILARFLKWRARQQQAAPSEQTYPADQGTSF